MDLTTRLTDAHRAIDAGNDPQAMTAIGELMATFPGNAQVAWLCGRYFGLHGAYKVAAEHYLKAVRLDGRLSSVQFKVGTSLLTMRDVEGSPWAAKALAEFADGMYRLSELTFEPGDVVIDVGAHIGFVSVILAALHPTIRIIALEPSSSNFAMLRENLAVNGTTNVTALRHAVTGVAGELELIWNAHDTAGATVTSSEQAKRQREANGWSREIVECVTLDHVFAEHAIDRCSWLKLDCEGAEWDIVRQSKVLDRVDRLSLELHIPQSRIPEGVERCRADFLAPLTQLRPRPETEISSMMWLVDA